MLNWVRYDPRLQVLEVEFNTGDQYQYKEVPESEYEGLMSAESIGKYMHRHIIDHYDYERLN
jgi:KTSC domain